MSEVSEKDTGEHSEPFSLVLIYKTLCLTRQPMNVSDAVRQVLYEYMILFLIIPRIIRLR